MRNIIFLFLLIFTISCTSSKQDNLLTDKMVKSIFDASEINDLQKIQQFFDHQIGLNKNSDEKTIHDKYEKFFNDVAETTVINNLSLPIDFDQQKEFYSQLSNTTFEDIWKFGSITRIDSTGGLKYIQLNRNGNYLSFLKKLGEQDKTIANYYKSLEIAGDISPSMVASLIKESDKYNIDDPKIRLVIAIHYLTLNDQWNRKERI